MRLYADLASLLQLLLSRLGKPTRAVFDRYVEGHLSERTWLHQLDGVGFATPTLIPGDADDADASQPLFVVRRG